MATIHIHDKLIKKCKAGNQNAQFEIYKLYYKGMYNVSLRLVQDTQEVEDVMQEAFLSAFEKLDTWSEEVTFGAWLKKIVVNKSLDYLKKRKMEPLLMREITSAEREKTLVKFIATGLKQTDEALSQRLTSLTGFHIRLLTLPPATVDNYLEAALAWHKTYLHVRCRHQFHPGNNTLATQTAEVAQMIELIAPAIVDFSDPRKLSRALSQKAGFDLPGLILDLLYLAALNYPELAEALTGAVIASNRSALKKAVIARLAASYDNRLAILERIHARLEKLASQLKDRLAGVPIRWVSANNIHLTLKFIGDVSVSNLEMLKKILQAEATRHHPLEISVGGIGAFPSLHRPRVIWVGVEAPQELSNIQVGIEAEMARLGYAREERDFSPHLTLGRVSRNATPAEIRSIGNVLGALKVGFLGAASLAEVHLYKSDLNPDGALYTRLFSTPLGLTSL